MKNIKELENAFDEKFANFIKSVHPSISDDIKSFYRTHIPVILDSVVGEVVGEREKIENCTCHLSAPCNRCVSEEAEEVGYRNGSNARRLEALARYQEIKKKLIK